MTVRLPGAEAPPSRATWQGFVGARVSRIRIADVARVLLLAALWPATSPAQTPPEPPAPTPTPATAPAPKRIANINVLLAGVGSAEFEHPNFENHVFPNIAYQRRVWRREMRRVPIWIRGSVNFLSEDVRCENCYTVWQDADVIPYPETVQEHTSDFTFRGEMLADLLHGSWFAFYAGGGFGLHYLSFSSNGFTSPIPIFEQNENVLAPSAAGGLRLFAPRHAITAYAEVRYLKAYGKTTALAPNREYLTEPLFEFTEEDAWSIEGGLGLHW